MSPEPQTVTQTVNEWLRILNEALYGYILIALLIGTGLYFFIRTKALPLRMFTEAVRVVVEPPDKEGEISSFRALMVSTASRVGVGNIAGVGTAIALGGAGSVFWMWVIATLGGASAFIESTLAQIYKRRGHGTDDHSIGGPAYYIQFALKQRWLAVIFSVTLIVTYMVGFNLLAAFNVSDAFTVYSWYSDSWTPHVIGAILAIAMAVSIFGGTRRLTAVAGLLVPIMATIYLAISLVIIAVNWRNIPAIFAAVFNGAFDFEAIFGGFAGSAMMYGIRRGLYSNEAGVGSAPNAAATASVSHPAKQGLVQMLSVFIDTMIICTITAFTILASGVNGGEDLKGAPLVTQAMASTLGGFAVPFTTFALMLFAFTTLIGNFYYAEVNLRFLVGQDRLTPIWALQIFRSAAALIVFFGALMEFSLAWNLGDLLMGLMALINLPVILILGKKALDCMKDYQAQRAAGKNPVFKASTIGITDTLDYWR